MGMRVYLIRGFDNYVAPPRHFRSRVRLVRETARRELVVQRRHSFNATPVYSYTTDWDLIGRPTNAVDSLSSARAWRYNRRSELVDATIGTNLYAYAYDSIGNRQWDSANVVTNVYAANSLNQYTTILHSPFSILHSPFENSPFSIRKVSYTKHSFISYLSMSKT